MALRDRKQKWDGVERRGPATVLVAGDDDDSNQLLERILNAKDYRAMTASTIESALTKVADQLPRVVVIDLSARGIGTSLQLLDGIRNSSDERVQRARAVVVARSAANRNFAFQSGADGFLLRPFHADDLVEVIEQVLSVPSEDLPAHRRDMISRAGN